MSFLNTYLFNLVHGLSGRNFLLDGTGIFLAEYLPYILGLGALALIFSRENWKARLFFLIEAALAVILSRGIITEIIRFFYNHPRPFAVFNFAPLIAESGNSFPSGHMTFFFALAAIIFYWNKNWGLWYIFFAAIIGLARIFVGVHWPADILGGAVIGLASGFLVYRLLRPYRLKIRKEKNLSGVFTQ